MENNYDRIEKQTEKILELKYDNKNFKPELLINWNDDQIKEFIRERLRIFDPEIICENFRQRYSDDYLIFLTELKKQHKRFDMSGYENSTGECTLKNQEIVNSFANLGIYDYTEYLFLDFYKGTPTLYLKYWAEEENLEFTYGGYGTVEIIFEIFKLTILNKTNLPKRRRL